MKPVDGFQSQAPGAGYPMLPKGAYVCAIQNVKIEGQEPDQQLVLRLEIIEGPYAGYFTKRFQTESSNTMSRFPAKYKGDIAIQIPNKANTKRTHPEWDLNTFNKAIGAIEYSNEGYHWDWNEMGLKGKTVGVSVQLGTYNGVEFTRPRRLEDANEVRKGNVKPMKDSEPRQDGASTASTDSSGFTPVETEDLPF